MQRKTKLGMRLIAFLVVLLLMMNSLLETFGDTLTTYLGSSSGGTGVLNEADLMAEGREIDAQIEAEGAVLLRNENSTLPLAKGSKVTILGAMSYNYICGGTGSAGGKYDEYTYSLKEALDGSKEEGLGTSTEKYLDVNEKAWNWLENAVGGARNVDTTAEYTGHLGTGESASFSGSDYATNKDAYGNGDWGGFSRVNEFERSVYEAHKDEFMQEGYDDVVIVTFGRSGAEGASPVMDYDGDGKASTGTTILQLSEDEKDLLSFCAENFEKTIVLVNSSAPIELGEIEKEEYSVEACLWIGHPGEAGLVGVAQILAGEVNPSGHLVDTYAYDMSTMPSFYNNDDNKYTNVGDILTGFDKSSNFGYYQYEEGIYVGFRFYETADAEGYFDSDAFTSHEWKNGKAKGYEQVVQYPFGYGLSYTTFEQEVTGYDVPLEAHGTNSITVKVTNTGDVAGKQVVQLYMQAPYNTDETCGIKGTGLQKAAKVLMGFQKTELLAPGASEEVTISFATDDLVSFDTYGHGCYVLEKGDYLFHVGENAHVDAAEPVLASLAETYVYNEEGVGKRDSDESVSSVTMSDVDAGDGNMLDGYLNRSDFASGMETIMQHESSCKEEAISDGLVAVLGTPSLGSTQYSYETYENGEKVTKTVTKYVGGASYQVYATENTVDGLSPNDDSYKYDDVFKDHAIAYGKTYYVVLDGDGNPAVDADGNYQVTEEKTDMKLDVNCDFLKDVPYDNEIWAYLADETTIEEQLTVQGNLGWSTPAIPSVGKARESVVDGPGESGTGNNSYGINTWFTSAVVNASTWNPVLIEKMGHVYARQSMKNDLQGAYAPAMNTHRTPFGGRNFEYYSEDGFIGGKIGAAMVCGLQSEGIYVYIKHMAMNDNDTNRDGNITWFAEQAAREIYLKDYEICVKERFVVDDEEAGTGHFERGENVLGIMTSLNRDGISMFHTGLYRTIVRDEWGYRGLMITDGVGPYPWVLSPGSALMAGIGQLGGTTVTTYYDIEGNAESVEYGKYALRQMTKNLLYQIMHTGKIVRGEHTDNTVSQFKGWRLYRLILDTVLVLAILLTAYLCFIKKGKGSQEGKAKEAKTQETKAGGRD